MRFRFAFTMPLLTLLLCASPLVLAQNESGGRVAPAVATILTRNGTGGFEVVGSGVVVRGDGVLLTAYTLVQGAREIQVRLANGETYDNAELVASDQRRNIAVLRIDATNTPCVFVGGINESAVGVGVRAVHSAGGQLAMEPGGVLSSISLADEIPGAGTGFRVLKFTAQISEEAVGGVLVDDYGRALGLIAPLPQAGSQSYAVPLYNLAGLMRSVAIAQPTTSGLVYTQGPPNMNRAVPARQSSTSPLEPMPPVAVPQRATTPLAPAGPGSVVVPETDVSKLLVGSRTLYITSSSNVFKPVQLLNELRKKREFKDWNLSFVDESGVADLILKIEHVPLTWEFPFTIKHQRTGVVITTGKIYAWGGGDGALLMASRVVERLTNLRAK
jgi:hypothetical protein